MVKEILGERYEIQQQLAKKAGRRTLLGRDLLSRDLVIVKLLNFSDDFEWDDLKLFEREAQTLKALSHPAIPRYLDYLEVKVGNSKSFALIQTYVAGKSLEEYLQIGRTFSEAEVKEIAKSLLQIMTYLHERQPPVIHRDIKPSNILLGDRSGNSVGQVYLVDFGSVQTLATTKGGTITVVGTYGYMPPEQFGDRTVPASDLYSLGATVIALVTGSHPADLPQKDGRIQFENIANINRDLVEWLSWMTEPSLDKRLSSASKALEALDNPHLNITLVPRQPRDSKIRLTKTRNALEIFIGCDEWWNSIGSILGGFIAFYAGIALMQVVYSTPWLWKIIPAIFSGLMVTTGLLSVLIIIFMFDKTRIKIDDQEISVTKESWGIKRSMLQSPREDINNLIYIPRYLRKDGEDTAKEEPAKLKILVGVKQYEIGGSFNTVSDAEIEWLSEELSNWLNIPIMRVKKEADSK